MLWVIAVVQLLGPQRVVSFWRSNRCTAPQELRSLRERGAEGRCRRVGPFRGCLRLWSAMGSTYEEPSSPWRPEHKFLQPQQGSLQLRFAGGKKPLSFLASSITLPGDCCPHWPLHSLDVLNVPTGSVQMTLYFTLFQHFWQNLIRKRTEMDQMPF